MHRALDWEARLFAYLEEVREKPFAWGTHDCCTFAAGAALAMTGEDAMAEFRGQYDSEEGSNAALARLGAGSLEATLDGKLQAVPPLRAHRGDVVLTANGLAIVVARATAAAVGRAGDRAGLVNVHRSQWIKGWRIPFAETAHG